MDKTPRKTQGKHKTEGNAGRSDEFTQEIGEEICYRIALGRTLHKVCKDDDLPARETVLKWARKHPLFGHNLMRARVDQMLAWADEIVELAEDTWSGRSIYVPLDDERLQRIEKKGEVCIKYDHRHVREAELIINTKKWLMSSFSPELFGQRQILDVRESYMEASDEELMASYFATARRAGMTPEKFAELYEQFNEDGEQDGD